MLQNKMLDSVIVLYYNITMSHTTKDFFESHITYELFSEMAIFLGISLSLWEFADGTKDTIDDLEFLTVVYAPLHKFENSDTFTLYGVFVLEDGEWQIQQFGTNQESS